MIVAAHDASAFNRDIFYILFILLLSNKGIIKGGGERERAGSQLRSATRHVH